MVGGLLVGKTHHFFSALNHALMMLVLGRWVLRVHWTHGHLRGCVRRPLLRHSGKSKNDKHRGKSDRAFHFRNPFLKLEAAALRFPGISVNDSRSSALRPLPVWA